MTTQKYYFAYGAWMLSANLKGATRDWELVGRRACVRDWRCVVDEIGGMNIMPSPGDIAWGVLWQVEDLHLETLDRFEAVDRGRYRRGSVDALPVVTLDSDGQPGEVEQGVEAVSYISDAPDGGTPGAGYLSIVISGAIEYGLPHAHIQHLTRIRDGWRVLSPRPVHCEPYI